MSSAFQRAVIHLQVSFPSPFLMSAWPSCPQPWISLPWICQPFAFIVNFISFWVKRVSACCVNAPAIFANCKIGQNFSVGVLSDLFFYYLTDLFGVSKNCSNFVQYDSLFRPLWRNNSNTLCRICLKTQVKVSSCVCRSFHGNRTDQEY